MARLAARQRADGSVADPSAPADERLAIHTTGVALVAFGYRATYAR
jgi:hypothetical protein